MTKDEALKLALEFVENSEGGTADLEAHIKEALAQPEQEPVAWLTEKRYAQLHTAQRTWVGLTDEELMQCLDQGYGINMRFDGFARIIEAKLKEKNVGTL